VLKDLQGSVLAELLGVGRLALGGAVIALSRVAGTPLSRLSRLSEEEAAAAEDALASVHAHGVATGDVRLENLLLVYPDAVSVGAGSSAGSVRVVVVDFGRAFVDPTPGGEQLAQGVA
jgi:hypothetical protein